MKQFFFRLMAILIVLLPKQVWAQEPYAVLTNDTLLTFNYDVQREARGGMDIYSNDNFDSYRFAKTAVIDSSFTDYRPTSTAYWFQGCFGLTTIQGMEYLNTQEVTDMHNMFWDCESLKNLDLSNFNTQNVTNMSNMFYNCSGLTGLDVTGFNAQNVTSMSFMFYECSNLTGSTSLASTLRT